MSGESIVNDNLLSNIAGSLGFEIDVTFLSLKMRITDSL